MSMDEMPQVTGKKGLKPNGKYCFLHVTSQIEPEAIKPVLWVINHANIFFKHDTILAMTYKDNLHE